MKEGLTMRVTFDTHVWNRMVFPERYLNRPNHAAMVKINNAIRSGLMRGSICESFGTLEAIKKRSERSLTLEALRRLR